MSDVGFPEVTHPETGVVYVDYPEQWKKVDPVTGAVAIRTNQPLFPSGLFAPAAAWCVATSNSGAHLVGPEAVASWTDWAPPAEG